MTEKQRILTLNNGELPDEKYDILRIKNIPNPEDDLNAFKQSIIAFLENKNLSAESLKWEKLLPRKLVEFTNQLEDSDYHKDQLLMGIFGIVDWLQSIKKWEWYSSRITDHGFEVVTKGYFNGLFIPLVHQLGIPHSSIFIYTPGEKEYPIIRSGTDVMTYKTFDPITFELKKK
ncbi:hypothetical protein O2K51_05155 [Apibacter raozihei]|uniref:hypothetical protein n=1 Tax=Apibacter raozihei TaxID=2500547 RepID=UPI000FE41B6A|nr:hypothetical protein [Apibacter raozihei]